MAVKGGDKLAKHLQGMARQMAGGGVVRVGFLEGATYPARAVSELSVGKKLTKGRRAKLVAAAGGKTLYVAQVAFWNEFGTSRAPARPFFRTMIADKSPHWGSDLAKISKATNYNGPRTLALMGQRIKDQLVKSIVDWPADNAPSTVARKGFNKGLVDKGIMQRAPDFEVISK
jgi:hypothetical protein